MATRPSALTLALSKRGILVAMLVLAVTALALLVVLSSGLNAAAPSPPLPSLIANLYSPTTTVQDILSADLELRRRGLSTLYMRAASMTDEEHNALVDAIGRFEWSQQDEQVFMHLCRQGWPELEVPLLTRVLEELDANDSRIPPTGFGIWLRALRANEQAYVRLLTEDKDAGGAANVSPRNREVLRARLKVLERR